MKLQYKEICRAINDIKKKMCVEDVCYTNFLANTINYNSYEWTGITCKERTLVATYQTDKKKVGKLLYFSYDIIELRELLEKVPDDVLIELVSVGQNPLHHVFLEIGFICLGPLVRKSTDLKSTDGAFQRFANDELEPYYNPEFGDVAKMSDAEEIGALLHKVFDDRIDEIPSVEQIREYIANKWVLLYRKNGVIRTLYIYQVQGKRFFSNYSYNTLPAIALYCLEKRAHEYVINNYDVKMKYSWINIGNEKSLRRNIADMDGVYRYVYVKEKGENDI